MDLINIGPFTVTWTFLFGMFCVGLGFDMGMLCLYQWDKWRHGGDE